MTREKPLMSETVYIRLPLDLRLRMEVFVEADPVMENLSQLTRVAITQYLNEREGANGSMSETK